MTCPITVVPDIHWIGLNDRETEWFEGLWPLPRGVSYNSYVIVDQKVALIDTVKNRGPEAYLGRIRQVLGEGRKVDYLVVNHMEPDHSGSIRLVREVFPECVIVANDKTVRFLENFYGITDGIHVVKDGATLDLGTHRLQFFLTPMVHWPETMMTYDTTSKVLFSGDAFGGFGALTGGIFDDEVDIEYFEDEILRYFSNIVGKYASMVQKAIAKLSGVEIAVVAATHGPIWRRDPARIIRDYERWSRQEAEPGVVLVYASMYGNTERMMEAVARGLADENVCRVRIHNVSRTDPSYVIRDAWRFKGLILGGPTYDTGLHPRMDNLIRLLEGKKLKDRFLGLFGTFGWSGGGVDALTAFAEKGNCELVRPVVEACCAPKAADLDGCAELARNMVAKLRDWRGC